LTLRVVNVINGARDRVLELLVLKAAPETECGDLKKKQKGWAVPLGGNGFGSASRNVLRTRAGEE
jgi:hypothetical protein